MVARSPSRGAGQLHHPCGALSSVRNAIRAALLTGWMRRTTDHPVESDEVVSDQPSPERERPRRAGSTPGVIQRPPDAVDTTLESASRRTVTVAGSVAAAAVGIEAHHEVVTPVVRSVRQRRESPLSQQWTRTSASSLAIVNEPP